MAKSNGAKSNGDAGRPAGPTRWRDLLGPALLKPTLTLVLGIALFAFNGFLVSTALPSAVADIGGVAWVSWAFTLFFVLSIIGGALAATLKARLGAGPVLLLAASVHAAGTVASALAPDMLALLLGRACQGLGEGMIAALCYALIPALYPPALVPKVFGVESMVWALAACAGPLVAGALTQLWSWRAAFLINLPATVLFMALVPMVTRGLGAPDQRVEADPPTKLPLARLVAIGGGILLVSLASVTPAAGLTAALLAMAALVLTGTAWQDRRAAAPLFPRDAFALWAPARGAAGRTVPAGIWGILLMNMALAGSTVYVALTAQTLWGFRPLAVGALAASLAMAWSGTSIAVATLGIGTGAGRADTRLRRRMIRLGPALVALGLLSVAWGFGDDVPVAVAVGQVAMGFGCGLGWGFLCQAVMDAADPAERDHASALLPTVQSAGFGIGAALAGLIGNAAGYADPGGNMGRAVAIVSLAGMGTALAAQLVILAVRVPPGDDPAP